MNWIQNLLHSEWCNALGWTLLHSLWQVSLIGLLCYSILGFISGRNAKLRYAVAGSALLMILLVSLLSFLNFFTSSQNSVTEIPSIAVQSATAHISLHTSANISNSLTSHFPWIIGFWIAGVILLSSRMLMGFLASLRMKTKYISPLEEKWNTRINNLIETYGIKRKIKIVKSGLVAVPTLIGYCKPVILIPVSTLSGIPGNQLEMIIAHELAHIKRHDYLLLILQGLIELLFFYHPVVWWLSSVVNAERENICDDLAVEVCGESLTLVKALNNMEAIRKKKLEMVLAFSGKKGKLVNRVERLLYLNRTPHRKVDKLYTSSLLTLIFIGLVFFSNIALSHERETADVNPLQAALMENPGQMSNQPGMGAIGPILLEQDSLREQKKQSKKQKKRAKKDKKDQSKHVDKIMEVNSVTNLQMDSIEHEEYLHLEAEDLIEMQREALEDAKLELEEVEIDTEAFEKEIEVELKEVPELMEVQEVEIIQEVEQELETLSEEAILKEFHMNWEEEKSELKEQLEAIDEEDELSDQEKERLKRQIKKSLEHLKTPEFQEKIRDQIESSREILEKQLHELKSGKLQKQLELQKEHLREHLKRLESEEFQQELQQNLQESKRQVEIQLQRLNSPEYRKEMEAKLKAHKEELKRKLQQYKEEQKKLEDKKK